LSKKNYYSQIIYQNKIKMNKTKDILKALEQLLTKIETDIKRGRLLINQVISWEVGEFETDGDVEKLNELASRLLNYDETNEIKVIEGVYDWYFMMGSDEKKYPVPLNYSSKTKLIPWDVLKLRIMEDGKLVYKLIWPAPRKYIKATLSKSEDSKFIAITDDGKTYFMNQAAVTFFKGSPWDELSIIINLDGVGDYAAIEAVIPQQ